MRLTKTRNAPAMGPKSQSAKKVQAPDIDGIDYGDLDNMSGIVLQRAFSTSTRYFREYMGSEFKPGFYTALSVLEKNPGLTQKALAHAIRRDTSTLVPFIDHMEKNKWVVRKRSETDRRAHELYLTEEGLKTAAAYDKKVCDLEASIKKQMGAQNYRKFRELLETYEGLFTD